MTPARIRPGWIVLALAGTLLLAAGAAQETPTPAQGKIAIRVEMVQLLCTVLDKKGQYVTNLTQDDFIVYENGVPQKIENFAARTDLPLSIAFLIDTSASVANKLKFEQEAASEFFFSVIRAQDKALLLEFDTGVTLIQDFTSDPNILARQLKTLRAAGGTSLYDALYLVSEEKLLWEQGEKRKTVLIISDGEDTVSSVTFEEALELCQRAGATIFAISTNRGGHFGIKGNDEGDAVLEQLASASGGKVYYPSKIEDLGQAFKEINQELRSQYSLSYRPANSKRDGTFRTLRVTVKGKDLVVRHRKGYFAPKE
jgi:Ca-activated chloride channel family protein